MDSFLTKLHDYFFFRNETEKSDLKKIWWNTVNFTEFHGMFLGVTKSGLDITLCSFYLKETVICGQFLHDTHVFPCLV